MTLWNVLYPLVVYTTYLVVPGLVILYAYRSTLDPLAKFPGPPLAKLTNAYGGFIALRRRLHLVTHRNHEKYGPVYRQGPDRLLFNSAAAVRDILQNPRIDKSPVYALTRMTPGGSVFDTMDVAEHRRKRRVVSLPLTEKSMRTFEPVIVEYVDQYIERISSAGSKPLNASEICRDLMGDIVGQLSFGYSLNMQTEEKNRWLLPGLNYVSWRINAYMQFSALQRLEPVFRLLFKKGRDKYLAIVRQMIDARLSIDRHDRHDLYSFAADLLGGGTNLGNSELWGEAFFFIAAGGTTPTTTISALFWYLSRYPKCYERVAAEVRAAFQSPDEIRNGEKLKSCTYLRACIDETLRIATPNTGILWREQVPDPENPEKDSPLVIDGHVIPKGTLVGLNMYAIHHSEANFPDPYTFDPERWLDGVSMEKAGFAPFSLGSRSCSGRALAYLEISLAMAATLWHFDFEPAKGPLGEIGGGKKGGDMGRERPDEYQQYDTFSSVHDGPYLVFRKREAAAP